MSEPKLISPMLDNFAMGTAISEHHGVRCYPAMREDTQDKYIIKVISIPASQTQLDALLLSGAYPDEASAQKYFRSLADGVIDEIGILEKLSKLEGFLQYDRHQCVDQEDSVGYDIYLLSAYRRTLERQFQRHPLTHLGAINLGLDLCSALSVCRRSGYLYVDLRPTNVYLLDDNAFRIGDLGFLRLDSLKYASLPDKYRSAYTAPEIADAFSELNTTIDVYAVGLILYQAYNGGALPFTGDTAPAEQFPAPSFADYEMSEIILKACAPNPEDRWEDPMQMGQALVSYMQRNGANDTPIVPVSVSAIEESSNDVEPDADQVLAEESTTENAEMECTAQPQESVEEVSVEEPADEVHASDADEITGSDDDLGSLTFLDNFEEDEPELDPDNISYEDVSEDLSEMLNQVDEIAQHQVPDPVIAPEAIEVPMPEPIIQPKADAETDDTVTDVASDADSAVDDDDSSSSDSDDEEVKKPKKKRRWLRNIIITVLLLALVGAAVFFYTSYYLVQIDAIILDGAEDTLTVHITSKIDDSLLTVVCSDPHGNQITSDVTDGMATFTDLVPDTAYTVTVQVNGFHKLKGTASKAYSTPVQTNIVQFTAVTGSEDGSVILGFTVDGPDSEQWEVLYSTRGEEEKSLTFPAHMATVTGLTIGSEYTFKLVPVSDLYITGNDTITYTASKLTYAEELLVTSRADGKLTVQWKTPDGMSVENWSVRCYNNDGYNETIITPQNNATFENIDSSGEYTVEVTAAGMSVSQRAFISKSSPSISNYQLEKNGSSGVLTWDTDKDVPENGWIISYTVNGIALVEAKTYTENALPIEHLIPNAEYEVTIKQQDGNIAIGGYYVFTTDEAEAFYGDFDDYLIGADNLSFSLCKRPDLEDWDRYDLGDADYTSVFTANDKISIVVHTDTFNGYSEAPFTVMYVIKDNNDALVCVSSSSRPWDEMWHRNYCELDVPVVPEQPGNYTMDIYFGGMIATTVTFTISE